jgi:hypothetical protein
MGLDGGSLGVCMGEYVMTSYHPRVDITLKDANKPCGCTGSGVAGVGN